MSVRLSSRDCLLLTGSADRPICYLGLSFKAMTHQEVKRSFGRYTACLSSVVAASFCLFSSPQRRLGGAQVDVIFTAFISLNDAKESYVLLRHVGTEIRTQCRFV